VTAVRVPLFRLDSGWLFILAGLAMCIGCALTSADHELTTLRVQKSLLEAEEEYAYGRLRAYEDFLDQLEQPDEALTRRLAAAELNLMPADEEPVLRLITLELPTVEWIDRTVERPAPRPVQASDSMLAQLATGQYRLWVFSGGVMCVFMGLLLDPSVSNGRRRRVKVGAGARRDADITVVDVDVLPCASDAEPFEHGVSVVREVEENVAAAETEDVLEDEVNDEEEIPDEDEGDDVEFTYPADGVGMDDCDETPTVDLDAEELLEWSGERELTDDVVIEALADDETETSEAGAAQNTDATGDTKPTDSRGVLSIRPPMSVAAPAEDEIERGPLLHACDDEEFGDEELTEDCGPALWDEAPPDDWDDEAPFDTADDERQQPQPKRSMNAKRDRKRQ
jgi:hypothetical protein